MSNEYITVSPEGPFKVIVCSAGQAEKTIAVTMAVVKHMDKAIIGVAGRGGQAVAVYSAGEIVDQLSEQVNVSIPISLELYTEFIEPLSSLNREGCPVFAWTERRMVEAKRITDYENFHPYPKSRADPEEEKDESAWVKGLFKGFLEDSRMKPFIPLKTSKINDILAGLKRKAVVPKRLMAVAPHLVRLRDSSEGFLFLGDNCVSRGNIIRMRTAQDILTDIMMIQGTEETITEAEFKKRHGGKLPEITNDTMWGR